MKRILVFLSLLVIAMFTTAVAFAQEVAAEPALGDALGDPDAFWLLLGVPITQFLKNHVFDGLLDSLGEMRRYGVIALNLAVTVLLAIVFEAVGMLSLGYGGAAMFGLTAGIIGSGLKDLLPLGSGKLAPASSTVTDADRSRLYR